MIGQGVQRSQQPVEATGTQHGGNLLGMPVWLTELETTQDPEPGKAGPAVLDLGEVAGGIEGRRRQGAVRIAHPNQQVIGVEAVGRHPPHRVVEVLGERDRGQPQLHRPRTGGGHVAVRRVPRPLGVDVAVGGQGHTGEPRRGVRSGSGPRSVG